MKRKEAIQQIKEHENAVEADRIKKLRELNAKMDLENQESNYSRARSINVGTSFGGTTEVMMRGDGGRHLWCSMQPVEVIELIHQLAANVGCNAQIIPRKDFASWRDWRVSEAETKHLNGHPPFVNDMAVFQKLGASGYDDEESKRIMDIISNVKEYVNENDKTKIYGTQKPEDGAPNLMFGDEDGLLHNKLILEDSKIVYMAGGSGGKSDTKLDKNEEKHENVATEKPSNG